MGWWTSVFSPSGALCHCNGPSGQAGYCSIRGAAARAEVSRFRGRAQDSTHFDRYQTMDRLYLSVSNGVVASLYGSSDPPSFATTLCSGCCLGASGALAPWEALIGERVLRHLRRFAGECRSRSLRSCIDSGVA